MNLVTNYFINYRDTSEGIVCTLRDINGKKISQSKGGGYDMHNATICEMLEKVYQKELVDALDSYNCLNGYVDASDVSELYGFRRGLTGYISVDGACGEPTTRKTLGILGLQLVQTKLDKKGNRWLLQLIERSVSRKDI